MEAVDKFTEVTQTGWGSNIGKSFGAAATGFVLFLLSFAVLWVNEGRINLGAEAEKSVAVDSSKLDASVENKLISLSGNLVSGEKLGDAQFVKPGDYLTLSRSVELYAWVEKKHTESKDKIGGGTETKTTYDYVKEWTSSPQSSSSFKYPEGHFNPKTELPVSQQTFTVTAGKIGAWNIDTTTIQMPGARETLVPSDETLISSGGAKIVSKYLFFGENTMDSPKVGDYRIWYNYLPNNIEATAFGKASGDTIIPFYVGKDASKSGQGATKEDVSASTFSWIMGEGGALYRVFEGSRDGAIDAMKSEHNMILWIVRVVGFLLMWGGLTSLFEPIFSLLGVLPFLKDAGKFLIGIITFVVCLPLAILTIIISSIVHNLIALIVVLVLLAILIIFAVTRKKTPVSKPA